MFALFFFFLSFFPPNPLRLRVREKARAGYDTKKRAGSSGEVQVVFVFQDHQAPLLRQAQLAILLGSSPRCR
jgi:hypothetical protein